MKLVLRSTLLLVFAVCSIPSLASAQMEARGITVSGSAKKTDKPEFLRMTMTISSKGSDTRAAIESIRARKKEAAIKLEKLEALEDSIQFGPIAMGEKSGGGGPSMQQMRQMMAQNFGEGEAAEKLLAVQPPVSVSVSVTADWKMPEGDEEDLLVAIQELKDGITEADVAGTKTPDELTPEQQELAAELAETMSRYSYDENAEPGAPTFLFGRRFPQSDADQLMQLAFEDAKSKAGKLAAAASLELGSLVSLTSRDSALPDIDMYDMYGPSAYGRQGLQTASKKEEGVVMIIGTDPSGVTLESGIYAAFEAK